MSDNSNVITSYKIEFDSGKEATVTIEHDLGDDFITDLQDLICGSEKVESVGSVCRGVTVPATSSDTPLSGRIENALRYGMATESRKKLDTYYEYGCRA